MRQFALSLVDPSKSKFADCRVAALRGPAVVIKETKAGRSIRGRRGAPNVEKEEEIKKEEDVDEKMDIEQTGMLNKFSYSCFDKFFETILRFIMNILFQNLVEN